MMMVASLQEMPAKLMKAFAERGAVGNVRVQQADKGLVIVFNAGAGMDECVLGQARGGVRYFQSFDGAASTLQQMGIVEFLANSRNWVPRTAKGASAAE